MNIFIDGEAVSEHEWQERLDKRTRVGRKDRDHYVEHLTKMWSEEYLTEEEFTERRDAALEAKFLHDLKVLADGLPPVPDRRTADELEQKPAVIAPSPCKLPHKKQRTHGASVAFSVLALISFVNLMIWPALSAASTYHGLGNCPPGFAVIFIFSIIGTVVSAFATLVNSLSRWA